MKKSNTVIFPLKWNETLMKASFHSIAQAPEETIDLNSSINDKLVTLATDAELV